MNINLIYILCINKIGTLRKLIQKIPEGGEGSTKSMNTHGIVTALIKINNFNIVLINLKNTSIIWKSNKSRNSDPVE